MANNKKLIHLKSAVKDKRPTAEQLEYGSLAINYNAENPFISIKDSNDEIVTFPSEKTIDNVVSGAVETILPEVIGDNYYDKTESDERFALKGDVPTDVYTKEETNAAISAATDGLASEQWVQDQHYLTQHQSLDNYYTKAETSGSTQISEALAGKANTGDIPTVPTNVSAFQNDAGYLTQHQSLANYYTKGEVDEELAGKSNTVHTHTVSDITDFPVIPEVPTKTSDLVNDSGFATSGYVDTQIGVLSGATDVKLEQKANVSDIPSLDGYATQEWVNEQGYLTEHQSLDDYYTKEQTSGATEIATALAGKADVGDIPTDVYTKEEVDDAISAATEDMATQTWVTSQGYLTEHQSLDNYYTKSQVDSEVSGATQDMATKTWVGEQGYLTEHQSLADYYTKEQTSGATEISTALAAKQNTLIAGEGITISGDTISSTGGGFDPSALSGYTTVERFESAEEAFTRAIAANTDAIATKQDILIAGENITISGNTISATGGGGTQVQSDWSQTDDTAVDFIKNKPTIPTSGSQLTNDEGWVDSSDVQTMLNDYYTKSETSGSTQISTALADKSDTGHTHTVSDITNMPTLPTKTSDLTNDSGFITSGTVETMIDGYATESWVQSQGYLTEHQSLSAYSTTEEVTLAITEATSGKADSDEVYLKSETSGATEISTALSAKQDTLIAGENITISGNTISATGGGGGGGMTEDDELLLATALVDLNDRKIEDSYVINQLKEYQKKGDYVTTSTLNTRLADYETALDEQNIEEVAAYALNDLNNRFDGLRLKKITQEAYDALSGATDSNTLYIITA